MSEAAISIPKFIAMRYVRVGKRSHLVSFMSAISIVGLSLGVGILITVLSVMNGFDQEMRENILGIVPHVTVSSDENLSSEAWQEIEQTIYASSRVVSSAPVIEVAGVVASEEGSKGVVVNGINAELEPTVSAIDRFINEGSLAQLENERWGIIIGETLAQRLQVEVGDAVDLYSSSVTLNPLTPLANFRQFELVGVFRVGSQELDAEMVVINIEAARALFRLRGPFNGLRIRTDDVMQADNTRLQLASELPTTVTISSWTAQFGAIYENIVFSRSIISFMLWLLVVVAAFNLIVSLIMIVRDKKGDIAILRTLGASPKLINRIFMWQGCLIGAFGIAIGLLLGIIGSLQITNIAEFIEEKFSIQFLNAEVYPIDFLPSQLSFVDVTVVIAGVFILALLATVYPARRAAAIRPAEVLRAE
ncbi:MAG: lipoprotein-releasing ABC transporter permease subunit [Pseudomonadota bacterium]|nr:lipoprotein-releasing ABC transporter permease subunit [Pseudomonadota bacterium]GIT23709.1 MAG: multidrug ABC transporter substrate-binding protein [Gammaproteobacteria bacterium]